MIYFITLYDLNLNFKEFDDIFNTICYYNKVKLKHLKLY